MPTLRELVVKNRSIRRFDSSRAVSIHTLRELIDLARLSATGANRQPLRFIPVCEPEWVEKVFPALSWAAYLRDWPGPAEGERPAAYIVILQDTEINKNPGVDHGIAAQSMLLGAVERGLGGCMIASIQRDDLRAALGIPARYDILLVVALGAPAEQVQIEPLGADGDIRYYRTPDGVHHVPKRALSDLILMEH